MLLIYLVFVIIYSLSIGLGMPMFTAKLKDGTELQVSLEDLDTFFDEHGGDIQSQSKVFKKRRSIS